MVQETNPYTDKKNIFRRQASWVIGSLNTYLMDSGSGAKDQIDGGEPSIGRDALLEVMSCVCVCVYLKYNTD